MMPDDTAWTIVAAGEQGSAAWRPMFEAIHDVQEIFGGLDQADPPLDVGQVVLGFDYFDRLKEMGSTPLYRLSDFEDLSHDFLYFVDEPEVDDRPGGSLTGSERMRES
jgi:hypothetical protein